MATIKEIKKRRKSIESTAKITKAMKLSATAKLQKTRDKAQNSMPYFDTMYATMSSMLSKSANVSYKYSQNKNASDKVALVVVSSNKGLAGGYNANIIREIMSSNYHFDRNNTLVYTIGNKARELLNSKGFDIHRDYSEYADKADSKETKAIAEELLESYTKGEISGIYLCYTIFKNTMVHIPRVLKLLPITLDDVGMHANEEVVRTNFEIYTSEFADDTKLIMNYEPADDEILNMLVPQFVANTIYVAQVMSIASENGARMTAMDSATKNANDLIDKLSIQYNRARQGAITQELTEIIAGANAI